MDAIDRWRIVRQQLIVQSGEFRMVGGQLAQVIRMDQVTVDTDEIQMRPFGRVLEEGPDGDDEIQCGAEAGLGDGETGPLRWHRGEALDEIVALHEHVHRLALTATTGVIDIVELRVVRRSVSPLQFGIGHRRVRYPRGQSARIARHEEHHHNHSSGVTR